MAITYGDVAGTTKKITPTWTPPPAPVPGASSTAGFIGGPLPAPASPSPSPQPKTPSTPTRVTDNSGGATGYGTPAPAPAPAPTPGNGGGGYQNSGVNIDYANDPGYLATQAENQRARADAARGYLDSLKQALLGFGSAQLARDTFGKVRPDLEKYLGYQLDLEPYFSSFQGVDNPDTGFSQVAQFERGSRDQRAAAIQALNQGNLFYSGAAAKALNDFDYQKQATYNKMLADLQGQLGGFGSSFLNALNSARSGDIAAAQDAYSRAVQQALSGSIALPGSKVTVPTATATGGGGRAPAVRSTASVSKPRVVTKPKVTKAAPYAARTTRNAT